MNLRTLKKLSKRAAPLLPLLGDHREQFRAEAYGNYHTAFIGDRKHWERSGCHRSYNGEHSRYSSGRGREIVFNTRAGRRILMQPPHHPRVGTIMVGSMSGYYEPEWKEESAWDALHGLVWDAFMEIVPNAEEDDFDYVVTRSLRTVCEIFQAAGDLIRERHDDERRRQAERVRRDAARATLREAA